MPNDCYSRDRLLGSPNARAREREKARVRGFENVDLDSGLRRSPTSGRPHKTISLESLGAVTPSGRGEGCTSVTQRSAIRRSRA